MQTTLEAEAHLAVQSTIPGQTLNKEKSLEMMIIIIIIIIHIRKRF
jgi:hypothetical protein